MRYRHKVLRGKCAMIMLTLCNKRVQNCKKKNTKIIVNGDNLKSGKILTYKIANIIHQIRNKNTKYRKN